jgi:hypothetical protein
MKKLTMILILSALILSITACGGKKDAITTVKKGHFTEAPKITVEEVVKRYKFIKPNTIMWKLEKDINNNEYVVSTSHFEDENIILAGMREKLYSGAIDTSVISYYWDEFFFKFLASMNSGDHETFDFNIGDYPIDKYTAINHLDIMQESFAFDNDNPMTIFFDCKGGDLIIDFGANDDGSVDVKGGKLIFKMVSPVLGKEVEYECIYNLKKNMIKEKLLSNSDFGIEDL